MFFFILMQTFSRKINTADMLSSNAAQVSHVRRKCSRFYTTKRNGVLRYALEKNGNKYWRKSHIENLMHVELGQAKWGTKVSFGKENGNQY